ncbi:fimbria/pilus outer membrane usher protein [Klebsiella pasteurii]|uniref:fimbria/pilus outer membrane usher protein n=1 Tax=Klebsiella pasteurii TaxID=2587529 RepID=UPI00237BAF1C|nr:fimbria/pilus outer membrane usher protein [Klebsiella pasteurii]MDD9665714.1 fimbrial biogenesis outer membrane usher protein [Klebsiella pasteurii]MDD9671188.1 fimbrial biogenesis outer membrane usher protein [Klebsiella pasteurii]MDD9687305.1 fimbrial biogenesis outer membrane usher protein [Klebsiella pasteurii]
MIVPAWARDYFDPALLSLAGGPETITDLSAFEFSGQTPPGTYIVTLMVNRSDRGQHQITFSAGHAGQVFPLLTPAFLEEMGVNIPLLPSLSRLPADQPISNLSLLIPDARVKFDFQMQRLELSIPQIAMKPEIDTAVDPTLWEQGIPALLLNHTFNIGRSRQKGVPGQGDNEQENIFIGLRGGINWQAWRLRSDMTYVHNESRVGYRKKVRNQSSHFANTYLQRDIQSLRSDVLVGEYSTGNDVFDSVPFIGVMARSSEEMLPNSQRGFSPIISGVALSNARVTVSQNGNVVYQTYVAPGQFRLKDLYQSGQAGELTVTVTESDGSTRTWRQAFSTLPIMQRTGGWSYELTAGRYNVGAMQGAEQTPFTLGSLVYGLPYDITLYGGALLADKYVSLVTGSGLSLGEFGALSSDITTSSSIIDNEKRQGQSYRVRYAKSLLSSGTSVDVTAYRYSTRNYFSFADFNSTEYLLGKREGAWRVERRRSDLQVRVSQTLGNYGSLYLSGSRSDYWGLKQSNTALSASYNGSLRGINFGLNFSVDQLSNSRNGPQNRMASFNMQIPFSLFSNSQSINRGYAIYQMSHDGEGQVRQQVGVNGSAADDRLSWSMLQGWSNSPQQDRGRRSVNIGWQGSKGMAMGGYSQSRRDSALNFSINGGLVVHPGGVTFSQSLGNTVAVVSAPGASGVSVINGGVRTDNRGYAVVPYLSPYQSNMIILDPTTLPDNVDLPQSSLQVYPTKGAVVNATFNTRTGYQALITLTHEGKVLPFGTVVTPTGQNDKYNSSIVGDGGQVWLSGLPLRGKLTASWGNGQCRTTFNLDDAQVSANNPVRILSLRCEEKD